MTRKIIGLIGSSSVGKDTTAGILKGQGFQRLAFADLMKEGLDILDPFIEINPATTVRLSILRSGRTWDEIKNHPALRREMEKFGPGIRQLKDTFWVDLVTEQIEASEDDIVVTDVRYENEAMALLDLGASLWHITRDGVEPASTHETQNLDHLARLARTKVQNDGTLDQLAVKVELALAVTPEIGRVTTFKREG